MALPQHDQLVEDLFDNVEHATRYGTRPAPRRPLSARLRAYRRAVYARGRLDAAGEAAGGAERPLWTDGIA